MGHGPLRGFKLPDPKPALPAPDLAWPVPSHRNHLHSSLSCSRLLGASLQGPPDVPHRCFQHCTHCNNLCLHANHLQVCESSHTGLKQIPGRVKNLSTAESRRISKSSQLFDLETHSPSAWHSHINPPLTYVGSHLKGHRHFWEGPFRIFWLRRQLLALWRTLQFTTKCNVCSIRAGGSVHLTAVRPAPRRAPDTVGMR